MHIEYLHASKYGNGADVAEQFRAHMAQRGVDVDVHHIHDVNPRRVAQADLYVFSSPGRMGRPRGTMRRFLKKLSVPAGTPYAVLTTEVAPRPDKKTGRLPTEEERARWQHVRPIMDELAEGAWHGERRRGLCVRDRDEGAARGRVAGQGRPSSPTASPSAAEPVLHPPAGPTLAQGPSSWPADIVKMAGSRGRRGRRTDDAVHAHCRCRPGVPGPGRPSSPSVLGALYAVVALS